MRDNEKAYWNHEVSKILGVGESTLRKWCLALEKNGYEFIRGKKDSRAFTQHDIQALTYFKDLTKVVQLKIDEAAIKVVEKFGERGPIEKENDRTIPVPHDYTSSLEEIKSDLKTLLGLYNEQIEFNKELIKKLAERDKEFEFIKLELEKMNSEQSATNEERTLIEMSSVNENPEEFQVKKKTIIERFKDLFIK